MIRSVEPGRAGPVDDALDAGGCLVSPGCADPHPHDRDPGATEKEDFPPATLAAVRGGVPTIFSTCPTPRPPGPRGRDAAGREAPWAAIADGIITPMGSDRALRIRESEKRNSAEGPAGAIGAGIPPTVTSGETTAGGISSRRLCRPPAEETAPPYRMQPRREVLPPVSGRGPTVVDPEVGGRIVQVDLRSRRRLGPWHGRRGRGCPRPAVPGGEVMTGEGESVGRSHGRPVSPRRAVERAG